MERFEHIIWNGPITTPITFKIIDPTMFPWNRSSNANASHWQQTSLRKQLQVKLWRNSVWCLRWHRSLVWLHKTCSRSRVCDRDVFQIYWDICLSCYSLDMEDILHDLYILIFKYISIFEYIYIYVYMHGVDFKSLPLHDDTDWRFHIVYWPFTGIKRNFLSHNPKTMVNLLVYFPM